MADPDMGIGALYTAETGEDNELGGLLPARKLYFTDDFDIALMQLRLPIIRETGDPLYMPVWGFRTHGFQTARHLGCKKRPETGRDRRCCRFPSR